LSPIEQARVIGKARVNDRGLRLPWFAAINLDGISAW
jgi:hypothetical protein